LVYTKIPDNPREINIVSTCSTNHINSDTKTVIASGAQYTKAGFIEATPLAIFGLNKNAKNADTNKHRANA
jgi:hypothetical protein